MNLDRSKVSEWVFDLFGTRNVVSATFEPDALPSAEVVVREAVQGRIGTELCGVLGLAPSGVRSVHLDTTGARILFIDGTERYAKFDDESA